MPDDGDRRSFAGPPYDYDVFISYSHGDPRGIGRTPLATWTHSLIDELKGDIQSTSTEFDHLAVWDDREADPTLRLTPMLKENVSSSALLVIVMSPRYLGSTWCKDELTWFEQELARRDEEEGCTLVVRALPTQEEMWPAPLKDERGNSVLGFWFHPRPTREGIRAFGWPEPRPSDREFFDELSRLSTAVQQRLRKIKQREALRDRVKAPPAEVQGKPKVYLHARPGDEEKWAELRDQMISNGWEVYPESLVQDTGGLKGLRLLQEQRRRRVSAYLDCDILLIVRSQPGEWIDTELETVGFDERRELDAFYHKRIPCAVLDFVNDGMMQSAEFNIAEIPATATWLSSLRKVLHATTAEASAAAGSGATARANGDAGAVERPRVGAEGDGAAAQANAGLQLAPNLGG